MFYILPKIHKQPNEDLPLKYPGRPIVSACNSPTENISKYIDSVLKPYMFELPSFVKDTTDFINKIRNITLKSNDTFLVTLDVASLYTNIPHEDGIRACEHFLQNETNDKGSYISQLLRLVLENNYFQFNDEFYLQQMGTAMGSSMAPAYASLFMGKFETDFLNTCDKKPTLWFRFLDDIFLLWDHSLDDLHLLIDNINEYHPNMKFTHTISKQSVSFLDVQI